MGSCAENTARKLSIQREEQDEYAMNSYRRTAMAYANNVFDKELIPLKLFQNKGEHDLVINADEEYKRIIFEKFRKLPTIFQVYMNIEILCINRRRCSLISM